MEKLIILVTFILFINMYFINIFYFNIIGLHDDDPVAVPNTFYKRRRAYFEDHKQFLFDEEVKLIEEFDNQMEVRLAEKLPEPKTLKELVEYGVENEWFACNVVGEVMEQVYNLESHCVLVVVDEYNYLYKESVYPSYRYANDKELDGHVPLTTYLYVDLSLT